MTTTLTPEQIALIDRVLDPRRRIQPHVRETLWWLARNCPHIRTLGSQQLAEAFGLNPRAARRRIQECRWLDLIECQSRNGVPGYRILAIDGTRLHPAPRKS